MNLSFHSILILAYTIPNIYVFFRIRHLFIPPEKRIWYTLIYLVVASIYPYTRESSGTSITLTVLRFIADYLLPVYLYLFLAILIFDIFLLINLALKIIPGQILKTHTFRKYSLIAILIADVLIVAYGIINMNVIRTSEYNIKVPRKSSGADHLRIAFASDFHLSDNTGTGFVMRFERKIEEIKPDLMIYGGDIIEQDEGSGKTDDFSAILAGINPRYGVFGVNGNHEFYSGQDNGSFFSRSGIVMLCDRSVAVDGLFVITGRDDSHFRGRMHVDKLLSSVPDTLPVILVDHRPTEIDQVSSTKADIQLSGHTHNGQLFPINLITKRVYRLSWGYLKKGNTHFFVSSGIRLWGPPVRTAGKSEIVVINVTFI